MKKIAIIGAGGFGREVACLIEQINRAEGPTWEFIGFFDDGIPVGERGVIGSSDDLSRWNEPLDVVVAIGTPAVLHKYANLIVNPLITIPNLISPDVIFMNRDNLKIGKGNIITSAGIISCNVTIGDFNIFNCRIGIGHDTVIGSCNAFMPSVAVSGNITIGNQNFFGVGSTLLQGITVGDGIRLGAGSVLIRNTKDNNLYMGNPATILKF